MSVSDDHDPGDSWVISLLSSDLAIINYHAPWDLKDYRAEQGTKKVSGKDDDSKDNKQAETFFKDLQDLDDQLGSYMMRVYIGDGNLRLHARQPGEENILGPHVWGLGQANLNKVILDRSKKKVISNRDRWPSFATNARLKHLNTCYRHPPARTVTYRDPGIDDRFDLHELRQRGFHCYFIDDWADSARIVKIDKRIMQDGSLIIQFVTLDTGKEPPPKLAEHRVPMSEVQGWKGMAKDKKIRIAEDMVEINPRMWGILLTSQQNYEESQRR